MYGLLIITALASIVLLAGYVNLSIQKSRAKRIMLSWYDSRNIEVINGVNTHVLVRGQGEPLVLVHGSQMNVYDWRNNIDFFSRYFKVYAFDMVGCGFTDKPEEAYTPDYFAGFIAGLLDHYGIRRASFVASSWGGGHVLHFALKHPDRVDKMVLSSPCGLPHTMTLLDRILAIPVVGRITMWFGNRNIIKNELGLMFADKAFIDDGLIDSVFKPLYMPGGINATVKSYQRADFSYVKNNLENVENPVLLLWGKEDRIHLLRMAEEMKRRVPGSELRVIERAGHLPHEEASNDFNGLAIAFLMS